MAILYGNGRLLCLMLLYFIYILLYVSYMSPSGRLPIYPKDIYYIILL